MTTSPESDRVVRALVGRRILVAEQEDMAATGLSGMLKSSGCAVVGPAATSAASLSLVRAETIDGAIVGFHLRDRNADAVMEALSIRQIPFLLTAARWAPEMLDRWRPYSLLEAPVLMAQVQSALARMLG